MSSRHLDNFLRRGIPFFFLTQTSHVDGQAHNKIFFFFSYLLLNKKAKNTTFVHCVNKIYTDEA